MNKPDVRPARPYFSSGPCAKPPGWSPDKLHLGGLGRSHRGAVNKARLAHCIAMMRDLLELPDSHRIGIVPGSDTGAFEMAMWTMLGARRVTAMGWESFGKDWVKDAIEQLKLDPIAVEADYGDLPHLDEVDWTTDVLFTWNGTTSGVRVPNGDWIPDDREGLSFADSTSAVFAHRLPWDKIDVATFSWQKVLGGEAAHGVLILGPRAVERLESYKPDRPLPKLFRLTKAGKLNEGIFTGATINTPSMLCVEDAIHSMEWANSIGGLDGMIERAKANAAAVDALVQARDWLHHLCPDPALRSRTGVCLTLDAEPARAKAMVKLIEDEEVAYDFGAYRDAPPGFRIWCGATVDSADIEKLGPWLDWAWAQTA
ncbi:phosphoserine transaminase [Sphingomicrobium arenosum]|uniref:phosphoserine transaminase n=1 Tax=Sphingomicrobium arenosum TaxID=2233861 RepID=UPI002240F94D|nr:phosphoserine transaminase [Sphingomicrobium arenosum]